MGIDGVVIGPVALAVRNASQIDLTHRDHRTALGFIDQVPINVESRIERVIASNLLQLVVRGRDHCGVEQANVVQGSSACLHHGLTWRIDGARVVLLHRVGDRIGIPCGNDVSLDVRLLLDQLARSHLKLLHEQGVQRTHHKSGYDHEACADGRNDPVASEDVDKEQRGDQQRHHKQNVQSGQYRIDVGVLEAGEPRHKTLARGCQSEAVEPVRHGLDKKKQCNEERQLSLRSRGGPVTLGAKPKPAVQVLDRNDEQESQDDNRERIADQEAIERQAERVKGDVQTKLRINLTE